MIAKLHKTSMHSQVLSRLRPGFAKTQERLFAMRGRFRELRC